MRELNTRAERPIAAPAHRVWAYRLDFGNLPHYNPDVHGITRTDAGVEGAHGAEYRFDLHAGGHVSPIVLRVTEAVPGELVAIEMDGALPARERFTVTPGEVSAGGSAGCVAAIDLTLLIPDHFPAAHDDSLLAGGLTQIIGELDRMKVILEAADDRG